MADTDGAYSVVTDEGVTNTYAADGTVISSVPPGGRNYPAPVSAVMQAASSSARRSASIVSVSVLRLLHAWLALRGTILCAPAKACQ